MPRARLAVLVLVPILGSSCALSSDGDDPASAYAPASAPASASAFASAPASPPITVPPGPFPSLDALCEAQKALVAPRLVEAADGRAEVGASPLAARCEVSRAVERMKVALRAPFLDVSAIELETGHAVETHIVVRTAAGWLAVPDASIDAWHDDPGCFTIERDAGVLEVRVEGDVTPALVIVEVSERGEHMEPRDEPDGAATSVDWSDVTERARACRLEAGALACDAPVVLRVENVPSTTEGGRQIAIRFETTTTTSAAGRLVPERRYDDDARAD